MEIFSIKKPESNHFMAKTHKLLITSEKITVSDAVWGDKSFEKDTIMPSIVSMTEKSEDRTWGKIYFTTVILDCGKEFTFQGGHSVHEHLAKQEYSVHKDVDGNRYIKDETRSVFKHVAKPSSEFVKFILELNLETLRQIENFHLFQDEILLRAAE